MTATKECFQQENIANVPWCVEGNLSLGHSLVLKIFADAKTANRNIKDRGMFWGEFLANEDERQMKLKANAKGNKTKSSRQDAKKWLRNNRWWRQRRRRRRPLTFSPSSRRYPYQVTSLRSRKKGKWNVTKLTTFVPVCAFFWKWKWW